MCDIYTQMYMYASEVKMFKNMAEIQENLAIYILIV